MNDLSQGMLNPAEYMAERETDEAREVAATEREERIKDGIYLCRAWDQKALVLDMVDDAYSEAALFYSVVARNFDDEAEIGRAVKQIVANRYREKAALIDAERRD